MHVSIHKNQSLASYSWNQQNEHRITLNGHFTIIKKAENYSPIHCALLTDDILKDATTNK